MTSSGKYVKMPDERSTHVSNSLLCNALASTRLYLREKLPENFSARAPCQIVAASVVFERSRMRIGCRNRGCSASLHFHLLSQFFYSSPPSTFALILHELLAPRDFPPPKREIIFRFIFRFLLFSLFLSYMKFFIGRNEFYRFFKGNFTKKKKKNIVGQINL